MSLALKGYSWYLFAFCLKRNASRLFKLSRIKKITALPQMFERREHSYSTMDKPCEQPNLIEVEFSFILKHRNCLGA